MNQDVLLRASGLSYHYGGHIGCEDVSFDLYPGEVLGIVGESGAGKTTVLRCLSTQLEPTRGTVEYRTRNGGLRDVFALSEPERRMLLRTEWGTVHQNPRDGLRMGVSAGGNRQIVIELIHAARSRGAAVIGIFHDAEVREAVGSRTYNVNQARNAA